MEKEFSTPLIELPTFLSTISMVVDDQNAIIHNLVQAERKSPPKYYPTRDLFLSVLEGKLEFEAALAQAWHLSDDTERKCAVQVLNTAERFLRSEPSSHVSVLPRLQYYLPNGMPLDVAPVRLRQLNPERLLLLYFWQTPLNQMQLGAAAAVLRKVIETNLLQYASCEIDFISVALSHSGNKRQFERLNWTKLKPLNDVELNRFWKRFLEAWSRYQLKVPREIRRHRTRGLFD